MKTIQRCAASMILGAALCARAGLAPKTPEPRILTPSGQYTTNQVTVEGATTANSGITSVMYLLNDAGPFTAARPNTNNWNKWDATITLATGSNTFQVWAIGPGDPSPTNTGRYFLISKSAITVAKSGSGQIVPNLNGKDLIVDRNYTMVAVPGPGQVFAGWSGTVKSDAAVLNFTMQAGEDLSATFIPSPFTNGLTGAYEGLFYSATNDPSEASAGYLTLTLENNGTFFGDVQLDGQVRGFDSHFDSLGNAQFTIPRPHRGDLSVILSLDLAGAAGLTGTIATPGTNSASAFSAILQAYKEINRHTNYDAYYTWDMPGVTAGLAGTSYGTATVSHGHLSMNLFLSDGTDAIAFGQLTENGRFPLYVSLYGGRGSLSGWLVFTNAGLTDTMAQWYRNPGIRGVYSNGFSFNGLPLALSPYQRGTNWLRNTNVVVSLTFGDLTNNLIDFATLGRPAALSVTNTNSASVSLNLKTGIITGSFIDPVDNRKTTMGGVVIEPSATAFGFFTSANHLSGAVQVYGAP